MIDFFYLEIIMDVNSIENQEGCCVEEDDMIVKRVESESIILVLEDNINS